MKNLVLTVFLVKIVFATNELLEKNSCRSYIDYATIDLDVSNNCWINQDYARTHTQIIENHGYSAESHRIITEDGYVLTLFHIISPSNLPAPNRPNQRNATKQVVLFQHGFLTDSMCWITFGSRSHVEHGYDVWLGNSRGTSLSREHTNNTISDRDYWAFSFHEMGMYDLPAIIDHITNATGSTSINYIGHSMGATQAFVYASQLPQHAANHLSKIITLAPVVYITQPLPLMHFIQRIQNVLGFLNIYGFDADLIRDLLGVETNCRYFPESCIAFVFGILSPGYQRLPISDALIFLRNYLNSGSVHNVVHFAQLYGENSTFRQFDYGPRTNERLYHMITPPEYNLDNIRLPIWLFYGGRDSFTNENDTIRLFNSLRNVQRKRMMKIPTNANQIEYGHIDFLIDRDSELEMLPHILEALQE